MRVLASGVACAGFHWSPPNKDCVRSISFDEFNCSYDISSEPCCGRCTPSRPVLERNALADFERITAIR